MQYKLYDNFTLYYYYTYESHDHNGKELSK